jgi:hypothetical protein
MASFFETDRFFATPGFFEADLFFACGLPAMGAPPGGLMLWNEK